MFKVLIYQNENFVKEEEFRYKFQVLQSVHSEEICYNSDESADDSNFVGTVQILIHYLGSVPEIVYVLPTWQLLVDDVFQEQGLYREIEILGKRIELRYKNYKFICTSS